MWNHVGWATALFVRCFATCISHSLQTESNKTHVCLQNVTFVHLLNEGGACPVVISQIARIEVHASKTCFF